MNANLSFINTEELKQINKVAWDGLSHTYKKNNGEMLFYYNNGNLFADRIDGELYCWSGIGWRVYAPSNDKLKHIPNYIKTNHVRYKSDM